MRHSRLVNGVLPRVLIVMSSVSAVDAQTSAPSLAVVWQDASKQDESTKPASNLDEVKAPLSTTAPTLPTAPSLPTPLEAARDTRERTRTQAEDALRRTLLPQAIEAAQFAAMLTAIHPTLVSNKDVAEAFVIYRDTIEKLAIDPGRVIKQLLPACYSFDGARGTFVPRATPELSELLALRDKSMRNAATAERALFRSIELATPIDFRGTLACAKIAFLHDRLPREGLLPTTSTSLGDILPKLRIPDDVRAMIAPTLLSYGDALTQLLTMRLQLLRENDAARTAIEVRAGTLWRYRSAEQREGIDDQLDALDDLEFANELAIRDASLSALRRLRAQLPRAEGRRLVEDWQKTAHPELFDDERILSALVASVVALPQGDADVDRVVLDAIDATYQRIEPLAEAACRAADAILPRLLDRSAAGISAEIAARITLLETQKKRRAALKETLGRIRAVTANAPAETLVRFDDFNESIAALERADRFERESLERLLDEMAIAEAEGLEVGTPADAVTPAAPKAVPATPAATPPKSSTPNTPTTPRTGRGGRGSRSPVND